MWLALLTLAEACSLTLGSSRVGLEEGGTAYVIMTTAGCEDDMEVDLEGDQVTMGAPLLAWSNDDAEEHWIPVTAIDDSETEGLQHAQVVFSRRVGTKKVPQAVASIEITDDDGLGFELACATEACQSEGGEAPVQQVVVARLGKVHSEQVTVSWWTENHTATSAQDFVIARGSLVFPPGVTEKRFPVEIRNDSATEPPEAFVVQFGELVGSEFDHGDQLWVWILDDD